MKSAIYLALLFTLCGNICAEPIPATLMGRWVVQRELPTRSITCWDAREAETLIGTELEYSAESFRWKDVIIKQPSATVKRVTAEEFWSYHSGRGQDSSQVTFAMLGIEAASTIQVEIAHPPAAIMRATIQIPGDWVLLKGPDIVVISMCGFYYEAERI